MGRGVQIKAFAAFLIQPYLFTAGGTGLTVGWQAEQVDSGGQADLKLFHEGVEITAIAAVSEDGLSTAKIPLPACGFGKGYSYQVTGQSERTGIDSIPCSGDSETSRFTFISDAQEGQDFVRGFAKEMKQFPGAAVVVGGDLVQYGGHRKDWVEFFDAMSPILGSRMLIPAVGNHEYRGDEKVPNWKLFFKRPAEDAFYAVELGNARLIVLNSCFENDPSLADRQLPWLREELAKPAAWKVVVFHHPAFSVGFFNSRMSPLHEWRVLQEKYVPLFETFGVDLVLNGHTHIYKRSRRNGINYLTAGPAGGIRGVGGGNNPFSLLSQHTRSMTHFELDAHTLRAVTLDQDGRQRDELNLSK